MTKYNEFEANLTTRSRRKVQSIIDNASKLFVQHGYHKVTMEGISQYANVSKVTLYKYFEDKQTLYEYILRKNYLEEFDEVVKTIEGELPFEDKIRNVVKIRIRKFYDKSIPVYSGEVTLGKELQDFIISYRKKMEEYRLELYRQGREQGFIGESVSTQTLELYFKVIQNGMVAVFKDYNDFDDERFKQLLNVLYAGILGCR